MDAPISDSTVAGSLSSALRKVKDLLLPESESLVTLLGHIEAAFEYTVEPDSREVIYHCQQALRIIEAIERRCEGDLPENVVACLRDVRKQVEHALRRINSQSGENKRTRA